MTADVKSENLQLFLADDYASRGQFRAESDELYKQLERDRSLAAVGARVEPVKEPAPEGSHSVDHTVIGGFIVAGPVTVQIVRAVAQVVEKWVEARSARSVEIRLDGKSVVINGAAKRHIDYLMRKLDLRTDGQPTDPPSDGV